MQAVHESVGAYCLVASLNEAHKRLDTVTKTSDVVLERLNAVE